MWLPLVDIISLLPGDTWGITSLVGCFLFLVWPGEGDPIRVPALTLDHRVIATSDWPPLSSGCTMVWYIPLLLGICSPPLSLAPLWGDPLSGWVVPPLFVATHCPLGGVFSQRSDVPRPRHNSGTRHGCDIYMVTRPRSMSVEVVVIHVGGVLFTTITTAGWLVSAAPLSAVLGHNDKGRFKCGLLESQSAFPSPYLT